MVRLPFVFLPLLAAVAWAAPGEPTFRDPIDVVVPSIKTDSSVTWDYDIVYVRARRTGDQQQKRFFTDFSQPVTLEPGADLMLLHPDGTEELLIAGGIGAVTDPVISFDAQWVYFSYLHDLRTHDRTNPPAAGADLYKLHLKTRKLVRLTNQRFSPNTGAAPWSADYRSHTPGQSYFDYGVFNTGPCPLPDGRILFTSNRDGFRAAKGYPVIALQLFVMDDRDESIRENEDPANLEKIGHLNLAGALHPVLLRDGRVMYSSLESQGNRDSILWGIWTIHPDGTNWNPLVSAFDPGSAPNGFHFQTQLTDGSIIVEEYYNQNNSGFGAYVKLPESPPAGSAAFGPARMADPRNPPWRFGRYDNGQPRWYRIPFMPTGSVALTPFTHGLEGPADRSILGDKTSPAVGKFTHPSGAPDNHLLTCYSPGPVNHQYRHLPLIDGGIYLIKNGAVINSPSEMRLIKNDPNFNECWPRAVVPYKRIYGMDTPVNRPRLANDGTLSPHLPAGTPFALVGTSSFYKRESFPNGVVPAGSVTASYAGGSDPWRGLDPFTSHGNGKPLNWRNQGADAGLYTNEDVHAVRILAMEPTTDRHGYAAGRRYYNHAGERLRILGEIPLRKFTNGQQPTDPDGHPDTSFLARLPADVGFTFQTLDKHGMVLNAAQTWHQLRPGEVRTDCGGCHAHSQQPTRFDQTLAGKPDAVPWDLTARTPLLVDKSRDQSQKQWDTADESGVRFAAAAISPEYHRDIRPIFQRSCVACHSARQGRTPAAQLDLDADQQSVRYEHLGEFPGSYYRLALDEKAKYGIRPPVHDSWGYPNASRTIRKFQSRRSLLTWKVYGQRLDGFTNEDHPSETEPGSGILAHHGQVIDKQNNRHRYDIDYVGSAMPPPEAVQDGKVQPLTDEDRRTLARWIDLGCPIDFDFQPARPEQRGYGWQLDDQRPTVALTSPAPGRNAAFTRLLLGVTDHGTGWDPNRLRVTASHPVAGHPAGTNLAPFLKPLGDSVYELAIPDWTARRGRITVSVSDRQGNITQVERTFWVEQGGRSAALGKHR
ncbi:MAG: hypothetical protein LC104_07150 [Bacteroidales bacterium]|nr:hypothetical protein [Bacteroidales bacterium]